ncbi:hypothetical protein ACP275_06G084800 [Erythranthe tilingii]
MSKKMKMIPSIFKNRDSKQQQWQWPLCYHHPKTLSFRAIQDDDAVFKTVNSVFLDTSDGVETPESWFTNSDDCASTANLSTDGGHYSDDATTKNSSLETVIRGVQRSSERLFFEPGGDTSSILIKECSEKTVTGNNAAAVDGGGGCLSLPLPYKESVAVALESDDPYLDFKKSMAEMVESHGLEDWDCLEELLRWYLKMNGKINHGFIVGAFVDLLVGMAAADAAAAGSSSSTAAAVCCSSEETAYSSADSCFSSHSSPLSLSPAAAGVGRDGQTGIDDQGGDVIIVQSNYL